MSFGNTIRNARRSKNISQRVAADALNVSQATLSRYEKGKCVPDEKLKQTMLTYYGITEETEDIQSEEKQTDSTISNSYAEVAIELIEKYKHPLWIATALILIFLSLVPTGMNPVFAILATYIAIKQKFHPIIIFLITGWMAFISFGFLNLYFGFIPTRLSVTPLD